MTDVSELLSQSARAHGIRLCVAESLTCGTLAGAIGRGSHAEEWFAGGVVAYQTRVKEQVLGLVPGTDPCSAECAEQLARGVLELLGADLAVSTTGVGGPDDEDGHPPGEVYLGWANRTRTGHRNLRLDGDPADVLDATVDAAMALLVDLASG